MSLTIGNNDSMQNNTETAQGVLVAKKAQTQTEIEGQMALNLIESATSALTQSIPSPVGNSGNNINIKV
jgi:hypothetical protein